MATKYANLKVKLKWAKVYEPDAFMGAENWKVAAYPVDEKEWDKFKATGLELGIKTDADGEYITLRRPTKKLIKDELVVFSPPEITGAVNVLYVNEAGDRVRQYNKGDKVKVITEGEQEMIPNGSLAIVNFSYYDTIKGKGHRLESLRILELAEYIEATPRVADEAEAKEEVKEVKKETKVKDVKASDKEELNDDIPW